MLKKKKKKAITIITENNKKKTSRINLTKCQTYSESKIVEEIKEDLNKQRNTSCSGLEDLTIAKITKFPN